MEKFNVLKMHLKPSARRLIACISAMALLSGCQTIVLHGAKETAMSIADDQRSLGDSINDSTVYAEINHYFLQTDVHDLLMNVNVMVRKGRVLLMGKVNKKRTSERAVEAAWKADGVNEVINEIEVISPDGPFSRASDEWIEKQLELRLAVTNDVNVFNYSIEVVNRTVYLLGLVLSQEEHNRVLNVARHTSGVKKVVSHLRLPSQYREVPVRNS
ncbi:MAG: BON domain-containing protein [Rickettsiales bacterium]|nr:BON domain-containing protein [Rickettsiales bacterium]